jgi:hypothetical protein
MLFSPIGDLVTGAWVQNKATAVLKLGVEFAFQTKEDVPLVTPMVGAIAG